MLLSLHTRSRWLARPASRSTLARGTLLFGCVLSLSCGQQSGQPANPPSAGSGAAAGAPGQGGNVPMPTGGSSSSGSSSLPSGGSGGSAPVPTSAGTAGSAPVDTEPPFFPTTLGETAAQDAYTDWKTNHLEDCGNGIWRVRWENAKLDATVSEGIGYGMLLTVAHDDRTAFDGLLGYAKSMRQTNQLMNWLRYGCDAHRDTKYSAYPDNSASDADLDVAMSLLMAECKWGDSKYGTEGTSVVGAIKQNMFIDDAGRHLLQPGDSMWFDQLGTGCVNYSYFAPGYYRVFAKKVPADADFWNQAAEDSYELLAKASSASTGLVPNWGSASGGPATADCYNAYKRASSYGSDAARTPWRIATDYLWFGTPKAKAWTDKVTTWVKAQGAKNLVQWYNLDGTPDKEAGNWDSHTAIDLGPFTVAAMTFDQATVDDFAAELLAIPTSSGSHDADYFPRMLRALSLLALSGKFSACGGK